MKYVTLIIVCCAFAFTSCNDKSKSDASATTKENAKEVTQNAAPNDEQVKKLETKDTEIKSELEELENLIEEIEK